jgi:hypothetical protein
MNARTRYPRPQLGSTDAAAIPAAQAEALDRRRALAAEQRAFQQRPQMHVRFHARGHRLFETERPRSGR